MAAFPETQWSLYNNVNFTNQATVPAGTARSHMHSHIQMYQHSKVPKGNLKSFIPQQSNLPTYCPSTESEHCLSSPEAAFQYHQWPLTWPSQNPMVSPPESLLSSPEDIGGYLLHPEGLYQPVDGPDVQGLYSPSPSNSPLPQEHALDQIEPEMRFQSSGAAYSIPNDNMDINFQPPDPMALMTTDAPGSRAATQEIPEEYDESAIDLSEGDLDEAPEDDSDQDYNPRRSSKPKAGGRGQRRHSQRSGRERRSRVSKASGSSTSRKGRGSTSDTRRKSSASSIQSIRPFTCPLSPYGCQKTFATKNEWKRHVVIQHLALDFYRCDLCPDVQLRPNDFNRKDLFIQHLRRMHITSDHGRKSAQDKSNTPAEQEVDVIRDRCRIERRQAPTNFYCVFCRGPFSGKGSFDEWLEHVGKHLASATPEQAANTPWLEDFVFREWLVRNGRVRAGGGSDSWILPINAGSEDHSPGEPIYEEEDAEGEPDD